MEIALDWRRTGWPNIIQTPFKNNVVFLDATGIMLHTLLLFTALLHNLAMLI